MYVEKFVEKEAISYHSWSVIATFLKSILTMLIKLVSTKAFDLAVSLL